ncbi:MAG: arsenate reductase [Polaromonas sp.]|nr:arsenate reductase [Polaromonas sp.]
MLKMYGIPHCDTVKKARAWLQAQGAPFEFHDFKKQGVTPELVQGWLSSPHGPDWSVLLNRKGTTWRGLPPATRALAVDAASAAALMAAHPSLIKRPVLVWPHRVTVGFSPDDWAQELAALPH